MLENFTESDIQSICHKEDLNVLRDRLNHLFKDVEKVEPLLFTDVLLFLINHEQKMYRKAPTEMTKNGMAFLVSNEQLSHHLYLTERKRDLVFKELKKLGLVERERKGTKGRLLRTTIDYSRLIELLRNDADDFSSYIQSYMDEVKLGEDRNSEEISRHKRKWTDINDYVYHPLDKYKGICSQYNLDDTDLFLTQLISKTLLNVCSVKITWNEIDLNKIRLMLASGSVKDFKSREEQSKSIMEHLKVSRIYDTAMAMKNEGRWMKSWALCFCDHYLLQSKDKYSKDTGREDELIAFLKEEDVFGKDYSIGKDFKDIPFYAPRKSSKKQLYP